MAVDHQPTFSRTSLNILILVCVILIVIFGQSSQPTDDIELPPAPKLNVSIWQTDSGANVWFNPKLDDHIYIQLDYLAGFAFNQPPYPAGSSQVLVNLLNQQAKAEGLPVQITNGLDFIEVSIQLSGDGLTMQQQIKAIRALLYHPKLHNKHLQQAKFVMASATDDLWQNAYKEHPYFGPKNGTSISLGSLHRAAIQKFQQTFMHPSRLSAAITGNISEKAAQIIMETLLPVRSVTASASQLAKQQAAPLAVYRDQQFGLIALDGSQNNTQGLIEQTLAMCLLTAAHPNHVTLVQGQINNSLLIEQWEQLVSIMDSEHFSDMMPQAKRQCIKQAFAYTQNAQALSHYLAWLNRYHLPSNFLHKLFTSLEQWQMKDWRKLSQAWFSTDLKE